MRTETAHPSVKYRFRSDKYSSLKIAGPLAPQRDALTQAQIFIPGTEYVFRNNVLDIRDGKSADKIREYIRRTIHFQTGEIYEVKVIHSAPKKSVEAPVQEPVPDESLSIAIPGTGVPVAEDEPNGLTAIEEVNSRNDAIQYLVGKYNAEPKGWPKDIEKFSTLVAEKYKVTFPNLS